MSTTRYIQAAITIEDHDEFSRFAGSHRLTLSDLIEVSVKYYMKETRRKEAEKAAILFAIAEENQADASGGSS